MLTIDEALNAIIRGVHSANSKYIKWSNGASVQHYGIESLISSSIAESIYETAKDKDGFCCVTLETSFREIIERAGVVQRGRAPTMLRPTQRADVVYWDRRDAPRGIIEIKRFFSFSNFEKDFDRTTRLLKRYGKQVGGDLRWGAVASLNEIWADSRKDNNIILKEFMAKCRASYPAFTFSGASKQELSPQPEHYGERTFLGYQAYAVLFRSANG